MTLAFSTDLSGDPVSPWSYILTKEDFDKPWHPKAKRIAQLSQNTICTATKMLSGIWACGRAMGPYKGRFPNGFVERFETMVYCFGLIDNYNPNTTMTLFPFGGSVATRDNFHTIDIKSELSPTFCGDITDQSFIDKIEDNFYDIMLIDPPYDTENVNYSESLWKTKKVTPYSFVGNKYGSNIVPKVRIGGIIGILHQLVYKCLPGCKRIGVIGITTGPNMRIRVLNLFRRVK